MAEPMTLIGLYRNLLGREPDAEGLRYWQDQINAGNATLQDVAARLMQSEESQTFVAPLVRLYLMFDRTPDSDGLAHWTARLREGTPLSEIARTFTQTAEFAERYGDRPPEEVVRTVYTALHGREPDAEGLAFWTRKLETGEMDLADVLQANIFSDEAQGADSPSSKFVETYMALRTVKDDVSSSEVRDFITLVTERQDESDPADVLQQVRDRVEQQEQNGGDGEGGDGDDEGGGDQDGDGSGNGDGEDQDGDGSGSGDGKDKDDGDRNDDDQGGGGSGGGGGGGGIVLPPIAPDAPPPLDPGTPPPVPIPPPPPQFSVVAPAQVSTFSVGADTVEAGDVFSLDVDGNTVTYSTDGEEGDLDGLATAIADAINADTTVGAIVTAAAGSAGDITLTAVAAGGTFTVGTLSFTDGGSADDQSIDGALTTTTTGGDLSFSGNTTGTITAAIDGDNVATFTRDGMTPTTTVDLDLINTITLADDQTLELPASTALAPALTFEGTGGLIITAAESMSSTHFGRIAETIDLTVTGTDATLSGDSAITASTIRPGSWAGDLTFIGSDAGGNETLDGGAGNDSLYGGSGDDAIGSNGGDDTIDGGAGDDAISGGPGADSLLGGAGNDSFYNLEAGDTVQGGAGDDVYWFSSVADFTAPTIIDTEGTNYAVLASSSETYIETLPDAGLQGLRLLVPTELWFNSDADLGSFHVFDFSDLTNPNDYVYVGAGAATRSLHMIGGTSENDFAGGSGDDRLIGGASMDYLRGGEGADTLEGGGGVDYYYYGAASELAGDVIVDSGENELVLMFSVTDASILPAGTMFTGLSVGNPGSPDTVTADLVFADDASLGTLRTFDLRGAAGAVTFDASGVTVDLEVNAQTSTRTDGANIATGAGNDTITGGHYSDTIAGGAGADTLAGGSQRSDTYIFTSFSDYVQDTVIDGYYVSGNVVKIGGAENGNLALADWIAEVHADAGATWTTLSLSNVTNKLKVIDLSAATGVNHVVDLTGNDVQGQILTGDGDDQITVGNAQSFSSTLRIYLGEGADEANIVGRVSSIDLGADSNADTVRIKPGAGSGVTVAAGSRGDSGLDLPPKSDSLQTAQDGSMTLSPNPLMITELGAGDRVVFETGQTLTYAGTAELKQTDSTLTASDGTTTSSWDGTISDGQYIVASWDQVPDTNQVHVPEADDATLVLYDADATAGVEMRAIKLMTAIGTLTFSDGFIEVT